MITLKDFKAEVVFDYAISTKQKELLAECKSIVDVERIIKRNPQYNWDYVIKRIDKVKKSIKEFNSIGYIKEEYKTKGFSDHRFNYVDSLNKGEILILNNINGEYHGLFREIKGLTIAEIKELMTYIDGYGHNYLKSIMHGVGDIQIQTLLRSIEMYEEQVDRQSDLKKRPSNIFELDKDKKKLITSLNIERIIRFLVEHDRLVWGNLSDNLRCDYLKSIRGKSIKSRSIRMGIEEVISNYSTLDELLDLNDGNVKVLNRFLS